MMMKRQNSSSSLLLLDPDTDNSDIFDPPAWRPGRLLQFADISLEDEPSVRPVSLSTERAVPGLGDSANEHSPKQTTNSFVVQVRGIFPFSLFVGLFLFVLLVFVKRISPFWCYTKQMAVTALTIV